MYLRFLLLFITLSGCLSAQAQQANIATGSWRSHLPNRHPLFLTEAFGRVYSATETGLFYIDLDDNSLHTLSKTEGLSGNRISAINYDPLTDLLVIAYRDANIDLMGRDGSIFNFSDIQRSTSIIGSKEIYSIYFHNRFAYLGTAFGVVIVNLDKREVKDTWGNLGQNGIALGVREVTISNDSIFLASENGVMQAPFGTNLNLLDYRNWKLHPGPQGNQIPAVHVTSFAGKIYANYAPQFIYEWNGKTWRPIDLQSGQVVEMRPYADSLYLSTISSLVKLAPDGGKRNIHSTAFVYPYSSLRTNGKVDWVADYASGLLRFRSSTPDVIIPNGPYSANSFDVYAAGNEVYVSSGAYDGSYTQAGDENAGFYQFKEGEWFNFNRTLIKDTLQFPRRSRYIVNMVKNPVNGRLYLGSHGDGLISWRGPGDFRVYNGTQPGVPIRNASNLPDLSYFRVPGVAVDNGGYTWMTNFHQLAGVPAVYTLSPDEKTWQSYTIGKPGSTFSDAHQMEKITLDDLEQKWIIVGTGTVRGVVVWNSKTNAWKHLNESTGKLPNKRVYSVTKDLDGAMWLGTDNGVAIFYNPGDVISTNVQAVTPIIDGRYLLEGQSVRSIVVDGGNRKWMGTNDGIWLFDENGTELLKHYTVDNSPLPSNEITDMDLNQETGELFIGTEQGLVSFRTDASLTENPTEDACIFPNPVRPGFSGVVTINCLPKDASVKITDLSGAMVYETKANGSTATWNMQDYNGHKAKAGMYLVLVATADGSQISKGKIAILQP